MAHHKSAKKRIKTSEKKRVRNKAALSKVKTLVKKVFSLEDKVEAAAVLKEATKVLDKTAAKGKIHKNNAARKKSALTKHVNKLAAK
ncbi:MAG: 30S ribosomal protein S20 [Ignavibacteriales bacterium]|nr:MAG: 30S ribosomal protein S20 [Stygiobacter sp.]KAF0214777.1 MAG: 30S ribosomal protein [Ignavibacteria bacterium]MBI3125563.1 30S ribosomal protein S20 [Ignavibacteriales bacterium]OGU66925.1 MAG: 30S ribosomal protein S20 [Stygiobacter sp. GWC2_38_9]OGU85138.1 MAG: 30S ribosomal protein S20 [Stygiobacter sp. RIFOXYA12_FULL_38_9]OGV07232.1 MAG: 30S ribosomal protein S20 [Stygiobacter sp. RIFOXYB2_FULL_37_11]OGV10455.1 MAG: 30S ribosomal protein S20 [Stygiobacter sp. RIFOXYA2_FULL_38_8]O